MKINSWENRPSGPESGPVRGRTGARTARCDAVARIAAGAGEAGSGYPVFPARRLRGRAGARTFPVASSSRQPFM